MTERTAVVTPTDVRYGFNGKEMDSEGMGGGLSTYDYGFRIYNPNIAKFLSTDPLSKKYPMLSSYQFASNTPIMAIDLDGLEAFIIHGTNQNGPGFTENVNKALRNMSGNTVSDDKFQWNSWVLNGPMTRTTAAEELKHYLVARRTQLIADNAISDSEPITLIGYSHGGNVAIQAAKMLFDEYGVQVNLVTISTPAKNSKFDTDSDNFLFGNTEDPQGNKGINKHYHIIHQNDCVWKLCDLEEGATEPIYSNEPTTTNFVVPNSAIEMNGPIEAHKLPFVPAFADLINAFPRFNSSVVPAYLNLVIKEINKSKTQLKESNEEK
jgi:RHS repeat-associated protein